MPEYLFVPGLQPHPNKHADGHRHACRFTAYEDVLAHGLDLVDHHYFWEAHEVLEHLWKRQPTGSVQRHELQAIIQRAAAQLKHHMGHLKAARTLERRAAEHEAEAQAIRSAPPTAP